MFTGIVVGQGKVKEIHFARASAQLLLEVPRSCQKLKLGASLCVDGVCLTVSKKKKNLLYFDIIPETLRRTRFRCVKSGDFLNLEKALVWNGRLDGHIVQGHVDGVGRIVKAARGLVKADYQIRIPQKFRRLTREKGSIALNGISLTIGKKTKHGFWVHAIPHTLKKTNIKDWVAGDFVNFEIDYSHCR